MSDNEQSGWRDSTIGAADAREHRQIARLRTLAEQAGLDPDIAESYHTFVVSESKTRHERIAARS